MKFGVRKPSLTKSIKARTTGRWKRALKRSINPLYGKKGMGWLHPKRAMYNRIYHRTTVSVWDIFKLGSGRSRKRRQTRSAAPAVPAVDWGLVQDEVNRRWQFLSQEQQDRVAAQYELVAVHKDKVRLLWLLTGFVGGHRFYLHDYFQGICMALALFVIGKYALLWWFLDFIMVDSRVDHYNLLLKQALLKEEEDRWLASILDETPKVDSTVDEVPPARQDSAQEPEPPSPVEVVPPREGLERFYPPDTEKFIMNDAEKTFFRSLYLQFAALGYAPKLAANRMSDGTLNFCYDGMQIGRVRLQKRKHTMQILMGDEVELLEGELPLFLDNIPRWLEYLKSLMEKRGSID